ncbi:BnaC05g08520D [Brassica napus]|nr:BnaC05g08520D [Brassica napus]
MELTWDEVLSRGTKHFSEQFSRFCDRKNECHVASMLCWNRAWPEPLLQAFFGASKSVWLVHLLANSLNPGLQIFRVERDDRFYPVYKEETGGDSVVKCKVVCKHCGSD